MLNFGFATPKRHILAQNLVFTGSIALCASRWYLVYPEADFEVFRPSGATRCTDGVKFGTESPVPNFTPSVQQQGCRTPKTEIFISDLTKMWNINAPQAFIFHIFYSPCAIFRTFAVFVPHFRMR